MLADGDNDCGDVEQMLQNMKSAGIRFHYETIGVGVSGGAEQDLQRIAQSTGGNYTAAPNASHVQKAFRTFFKNLRKFILVWRWKGPGTSRP